MAAQLKSDKPKRPKTPEKRPPETGERSTERGKVLQWRPRPTPYAERSADADFFEFPHQAPAMTITARIFAAERRFTDPRRGRTVPWHPGRPPGPFWRAD